MHYVMYYVMHYVCAAGLFASELLEDSFQLLGMAQVVTVRLRLAQAQA